MKRKKKPVFKKEQAAPGQERLFERALEAHQAGDIPGAEKMYRRVVLAMPTHAQTLHLLGVTRLQQNDLAQAKELIGRSVVLAPENPMAHYNLALAHEKAGEIPQAVVQYREAVRLDPSYTAAWRVLGDVLCMTGAFDEAVRAYKQTLEKEPEDLGTLNNLGNAYVSLGSFETARECFESVLAREPEHAPTRNNLAGVLRELGRMEEAAAQYEKAIALDPELAAAHLALADLFFKAGEFNRAEAAARRALELEPGADAWFRLGAILQQMGDGREAGECYEKTLACAPEHTIALNNLGTLAEDARDYGKAIEFFLRSLETDSGYWEAWSNLANAYEKKGALDKAEQAARKGVACDENSRSVLRLAYILQKQKRPDDARRAYARVLELDPEDSLGVTLYLAGLGLRDVPDKAPDAHIRQLFDQYAGKFDEHLLDKLEYKGPQVVLAALTPWFGRREAGAGLDILDLGCGTGLCGIVLRPYARSLDGVDLSPKMIANARERDLYDHLEVAELTEYLENCGRTYDLAAAGDVFVYIGELEPVFTAVRARLRPGGAFVFTVEKEDDEDEQGFVLTENNRYAHTPVYLRTVAAKTGFDVFSLDRRTTRKEALESVRCLVAVLTPRE